MEWWVTALIVMGVLFLFFCLLPVQIHIRYVRDGEKDELWIQLQTLFGIIKYTIEIPIVDLVMSKNKGVKVKAAAESGLGEKAKKRQPLITIAIEQFRRILRIGRQLQEHLHQFNHHVRKATKKFRIVKMSWQTEFGTGDAAMTGTAAGLVWMIKGSVLGVLANFFSLRVKPNFAVCPNYHSLMLRTSLDCIIRFWVGQAIVAGIQMGIYMLREGKKSWQIIRSKA
ncbi:DUF2953 domain-containing protein [Effusibacillus consociatus]|uniref:DUF2953 domain-containing protein n=1 Tax=Effusibacillus consociatus TaxID=1117041 RepID=A0ABV9Q3R1_9BACL